MRRPFFRVPAITLSTLPILYRHSGERRNPVERSLWVLTFVRMTVCGFEAV